MEDKGVDMVEFLCWGCCWINWQKWDAVEPVHMLVDMKLLDEHANCWTIDYNVHQPSGAQSVRRQGGMDNRIEF